MILIMYGMYEKKYLNIDVKTHFIVHCCLSTYTGIFLFAYFVFFFVVFIYSSNLNLFTF